MKVPASKSLSHSLYAANGEEIQLEGKGTTNYRTTDYLLKTYARDNVKAEVKTNIEKFKQPLSMITVCYLGVLWEKK